MASKMHVGVAGLLFCSLFALEVNAQQETQAPRVQGSVLGERDRYVVSTTGAWIERDRDWVPPPVVHPALDIAGVLWSRPDGGEGWIGRNVAVGNHGTQVFTEYDTASDHAELLSGFDQDPVTPVWGDPIQFSSQNAHVDSAETTDDHVTCRQIPNSGLSGPGTVVVERYTSSSANPDWTYTFPSITQAVPYVGMTRDGTRIVAAMLNMNTANLEIAVFNASSSTPISYSTVFIGPQLQSFALSGDGSTLFFSSGTGAYVWDVATHTVLGQWVLLTSLQNCSAISGDGSVFAYGGFNTVDIYERQPGGNYAHTYQRQVPGQAVCSRIRISDDSSTIVYGFNLWDTNLGVRIEALDVPSKTVSMTDIATGAGTYQNIVSDIGVSADGDHFAVGLWGDEANLCPELRFYRRHQNAPVATYNYPGSIFAVDMSADGKHVAVAAKAVHANQFAGGGQIDFYAFDDEDFVGHGVPTIGSKVRFEMSGTPNAPARLLFSPAAAAYPMVFPNIGTLHLQRWSMTAIPIDDTDATGITYYEYQLPTDPAFVGTTLYFQGFITTPRRLTRDWAQVTILP